MQGRRTASQARTGRADGIQLAADRLKGLRGEQALTQQQAARELHRLVHPSGSSTTEAAQLTSYQRIESTGRTSRRRAEALAQLYGTTLAVLQGDTPEDGPSLAHRVETQIRRELSTGENAALQERLERLDGDGDHASWLAEDLAIEIEEAQLAQNPVDISRLAHLTGWTEREVQNAGAQLGYWMVVSALRRTSHITTGLQSALQVIKDESLELLQLVGADATISLRDEPPWLRVEISSDRWAVVGRPRLVFSLVRCLPTSQGIQWQNPTWRDRSWLDWYLPRWAFSNAEFVKWQGEARPRDVRQLRLLIERSVGSQEAEQIALHQGDLGEVSDDYLKRAAEYGSDHDQALRLLRVDLFDALVPHLAEWPLERWHVRAGEAGISVTLDLTGVPYRTLARSEQRPPSFEISLVEISGDRVRAAPWRQITRDAVAARISERLKQAVKEAPPHPDLWQRG
jgi:transcriptional regulator with XRE-family HTH domain